jgi:hypothetical protein
LQVDPNGIAFAIDLEDLTPMYEMLGPAEPEQCQTPGDDVDALLIQQHRARTHPAIVVLRRHAGSCVESDWKSAR